MAINWLDDVGAPVLVTAANIATKNSTSVFIGQNVNDLVIYGLTAAGYLAASMGWAGRYNGFVKNVGIAAAPLAFERLYDKIRHTTSPSAPPASRMARLGAYVPSREAYQMV